MKQATHLKIQASLGFAVIAVALVGLAPPTAQAQKCYVEESYIGNLPGCVNPPANEEECRAFAGERSRIEYETHNANVGEIQTLYNEAIEVSGDIFSDELKVINAIQGEAHRVAKSIAATAIAGAKAKFSACVLAAAALPSPADFAVVSKCMSWHALAMAGIITALNRSIDAADARWKESYDRIDAEQRARDSNIELRKINSLKIENVRNQFQTGLIATDLEHCIWRVNND